MTEKSESTIALRAIQMYEAFATLKRPVSLSELAAQIGIPVSSCHGLLKGAQARGYVYPIRPRGPLYPTRRMLDLCQVIAENDPVTVRIADDLAALVDRTQETVILAKRIGTRVIYVDVVPSPHRIRLNPLVGEVREIPANSMGKALLGTMSAAERAKLLPTLSYVAHTPQSLMSAEALDSDVDKGVQRGWHENFAESDPDVGGISAAVFLQGEPYALCVAGPLHRMLPNYKSHAEHLLATIRRITDADAPAPLSV
ncbi:MAG: IclR family transcriptional regulator [Burkholderiaceae bacterium]